MEVRVIVSIYSSTKQLELIENMKLKNNVYYLI